MSELERERIELQKANRHILEGEERIRRQEEIVAELRAAHLPYRDAEMLLDTLADTLTSWRGHRVLIVERIEHLEELAAERAAKPGS